MASSDFVAHMPEPVKINLTVDSEAQRAKYT
jgi:hypothetical protein